MTLLLLPATRPRELVNTFARILVKARAVSRPLQARAERNATVRAATVAPRRSCIACCTLFAAAPA